MKDVTAFVAGILTSAAVMFPVGVLFWLEVFNNATVEDNNRKLAVSLVQQAARLKPASAVKDCWIFEGKMYCEYSIDGQRKYLIVEDTK